MSATALFNKYATIDTDGTVCFDFSEIPAKYYNLFFENFPSYALENISRLCLNCEKRREYEAEHPDEKSFHYPKEIDQSIANKVNKEYTEAISEFLIAFFQKTKKLKALTLSSLDLDHDCLIEIIKEIPKCKTLESLVLVDLSLQDDGVKELCATTRQHMKKIELIECDVTDESIKYIKKYVELNQVDTFQVTGNNFSEASSVQLRQAIEEAKSRDSFFNNNSSEGSDFDEEAIKKENKKLLERIRAIREIVNPFEYSNNGVFVVGPGAKAFTNYLLTLQKKLEVCGENEDSEEESED
ncbi:hypothetical protein TRFO_29632 [Tritrichomonas foetus]|uniref:Uncharacterized protein n=1 Tax=Tritrichomonas foetus TaxID=1144522 RepID=A0A1J4K0N9_9EUKA|nr:hypothetical protein TRFO_29632 [Tritrichomonas foetus]|eukprot:OHT03069.1 hypothetical protein TRFO_29632 [Tritrichomonas foetus]